MGDGEKSWNFGISFSMVFKAVFEDHGESFIIHWQGVGRSSFAHPSFRRTGCVWISVRAFCAAFWHFSRTRGRNLLSLPLGDLVLWDFLRDSGIWALVILDLHFYSSLGPIFEGCVHLGSTLGFRDFRRLQISVHSAVYTVGIQMGCF